jgi:hypothetical protein
MHLEHKNVIFPTPDDLNKTASITENTILCGGRRFSFSLGENGMAIFGQQQGAGGPPQTGGQGPRWKYGQFGPGGGSIPEFVMRTGSIAPFNPMHARHDISERSVAEATRVPVGYPVGVASYSPPPMSAAAAAAERVAQAQAQTAPAPAATAGILLGADAQGRPVRQFDLPGAPSAPQAKRAVAALRQTAAYLRQRQISGLVAPIVGGPLAALVSGDSVVLRWPNGGVAIAAAL